MENAEKPSRAFRASVRDAEAPWLPDAAKSTSGTGPTGRVGCAIVGGSRRRHGIASGRIGFPQELVHHAEDGERHIADVKTDGGWAIEFQHSYIKPEERRSRDAFYEKLVWVVDGLRRKTDQPQLEKAWERGRPVGIPTLRRAFRDECRLLREWAGSPGPVFVDIGGPNLVWILGGPSDGWAYLFLLPRAEFIGIHRGTGAQNFDSFAKEVPERIAEIASSRRGRRSFPDPLQVRERRRRRTL